MTKSKNPEPPFYVAVRFARLRDQSIGQTDEIQALFDILKATENIMKMSNDSIIRLVKKQKPPSPEYIKQTTFNIVVTTQDALSKYMDSKTARIAKLLDYFRLDGKVVNEETQKLKEFEVLWDDIKQEYERVKNQFMEKPTSRYTTKSFDEFKIFQDLISKKGIPLIRRLNELEDKIQKDMIYQIALFTKASSVIDSNNLYKLLTDEP